MRRGSGTHWLVAAAVILLIAAGWFFLSAIHSPWLSATPVSDPEPYRQEAMGQWYIAVALLIGGVLCGLAAWRLRKSRKQIRPQIFVMAGPDPAIHERLHVDPRVKPGDDEVERAPSRGSLSTRERLC